MFYVWYSMNSVQLSNQSEVVGDEGQEVQNIPVSKVRCSWHLPGQDQVYVGLNFLLDWFDLKIEMER